MKVRFLLMVFICSLMTFTFSELTNAQSLYRYEYDDNNRLIGIYKNGAEYMTFEYDKNGNVTKRVVLSLNVKAEVIANNTAKLTWDSVPGATGYHVFLISHDGIAVEVANTTETSIEFQRLNINSNYSFYIKYQFTNGELSDESNIATLTMDKGDQVINHIQGSLLKETFPIGSISFSVHSLDGTKWYDTISKQDGQFELLLPDGNYQLDGIWIESEGKWYERNQRFIIFNGQLIGASELTIMLNELHTITGTLTKGSEVLSNVTFSVHTKDGDIKWFDTVTDASGHFTINLPSGTYILEGVWVNSENHWYEIQREFLIQGPSQVDIDVLTQNGTLSGTLKKGDSLLSNVNFSIRTTSGEVKWYDIETDASGNFSKVIPNGAYVSSENLWFELQKEIVINGNLQLTINVLDPLIGNLLGTVKKGTEPVPHTVFSICSVDDGKWYDAETDVNGNFEFNVPEGTYTIAGIWVGSENKWYELNQSFSVTDSLEVDINILDLTITIRANTEN